MALSKSSQDVWVYWLSAPPSRGEKSRSQSPKEAWSYRGVSTFETDANTHLLGQYGDQREKSHKKAEAHLPASSFNQLCPETSMKWDPECAIPSGYSSHMSLLGWSSHGVCFSRFNTLIFNITLLNLVFRGRDLFQGLKVNTLKKWVVEVVEAPTAISKRIPH